MKKNELELKNIEPALPMWRIVLNQFLEHKLATVGFGVILFFLGVALCAPFLVKLLGQDPNSQNVAFRYQGPFTRVNLSQRSIEIQIEDFVQKKPKIARHLELQILDRQLVAQSLYDESILFDFLSQYPLSEARAHLENFSTKESEVFLDLLSGFTRFHILGTDELGRDVLARLIYGTRVSISVGLLVALTSGLIGLIIGSLAGFYGGYLDSVMMRITDALLSLPILVVLIVMAAVDLSKAPVFGWIITDNNQSMMKLVVILCLFSWMTIARLVRSSILSLKNQEFVLAARTIGVKDYQIILTHLVPNVMAPLLVAVTLGIGNSILFEAALSFLGLGIQPPTPSWGNMLTNAQELVYQSPLLAIAPGLLILVTVISFNYVGDGLQDAMDPKAIRR